MDTQDDNLSDLELLASAVQDAMDAYSAGVLVGALDEAALERAVRRARRQDMERVLRARVVPGDAA